MGEGAIRMGSGGWDVLGELLNEKYGEGKKWASEVQKEGQGGEFHGNEGQQSEFETDEDDPLDPDFIDSDYEQIGETEEVDIDDAVFEEHVDNLVEDEPKEMGYAREISDEVQNSEDIHSKNGCEDSKEDDKQVGRPRKKRTREQRKAICFHFLKQIEEVTRGGKMRQASSTSIVNSQP
ncbi:hypothetical protein ACE6H2_015732 [Prunus campanulata]